ncbi:MAG TPA: hypothetical protein VGC97_03700 [Pyrinomonadaceae bacterium]|jgi:hypothetical protein
MKTCPECKSVYTDDNLTTCPNDGTELKAGAASPKTDGKAAAPPKTKSSPVLVLVVAGVLIFLGGIWWFSQKSKNPSNVKPASNTATKPGNAPTNSAAPETKAPTMTDVPVGGAQSPTEAYRMLFAAVKSQEPAKIKSMLSQGSMGLAQMASGQQKKPVEEVIKNGFTETTFVDDYPQLRDERIKGNFGAVEVWNETRKQWDDIPFVLEDGSWKAAFGDAFGGKWQSPGKSQGVIEQENANAQNPNLIQKMPAGNSNTSGNFQGGGKLPRPK